MSAIRELRYRLIYALTWFLFRIVDVLRKVDHDAVHDVIAADLRRVVLPLQVGKKPREWRYKRRSS